ncbi:phospholipase [Streptomyces sp. NBC_00435]|uniref:phospholipase n=1 Tax=Streptomyces sp. NBC_00435 TaxID=2903649 RepID=UPI002E1E04B9
MRVRARASALAACAAAAVLALAPPASAAPGEPQAPRVPADKPRVLTSWTQTTGASQSAWTAARGNRVAWAAYGFDWSTDYCTTSPDNPFGFPFRMACARHDFGYRNYKAAMGFPAAKARLDEMFRSDLNRVCARYTGVRRTSCEGTAWTYYQAVRTFGAAPGVSMAQRT